MPRSTGISTKQPHVGPNRSRIGSSAGQVVAGVAREDQVAGQRPGPPAPRVHLGGVQELARRASTNAFVRSAARRRGLGVLQRLARDATSGSKVSSATPSEPSFAYAGSVFVTSADSGPSVGADHQRRRGARRSPAARTWRPASCSVSFTSSASACGLLGGEVAADAAVDDAPAVRGGEVDPVGEVAVAELHAAADRLDDPAAGMLLARVVAEDREHGDVGLGRDPLAHRDDDPGAAAPRPARRGPASRAASSGVRPSSSGIGSSPSPSRHTYRSRFIDGAFTGTSRSGRTPRGRGSRRRRARRRSRGGP